ncbi:MAG: amidohydrolase family protein [Oscillospiraceae bacterium]|nr:amidohydrolase family protein [Oscillospiraceae bacterium]
MKVQSTRIYMEDGCKAGVLTIENGKITAFTPGTDPEAVDYGDKRIIPGIFDTHNHATCGFNPGEDFGTLEERKALVKGYLKALASQGTVNVFPTVTPVDAIAAVAAVHDEGPQDGANILGIHSEGPWLSRVGEKGIRTGWPEVSVETAKAMVEAGHGLLRLVALAPEIPGIEPVMEYFLSQGVDLAAAHSDNNYVQATAAYDKGVSVATHTGNVMTGLHHRDVGGLGAALLHEGVECEVICDGLHICNEMLKLYFRMKSTDRFMMISDLTVCSGGPVGRYKSDSPEGDMNLTPEGFLMSDAGRLRGSSQPVLYDIGNLVEKVGVPMETVLKMACLNPCKKYGFADRKGTLAVGKDADFAVITDDYKAQATYSEGRKVYDRDVDGVIINDRFFEEFRVK